MNRRLPGFLAVIGGLCGCALLAMGLFRRRGASAPADEPDLEEPAEA